MRDRYAPVLCLLFLVAAVACQQSPGTDYSSPAALMQAVQDQIGKVKGFTYDGDFYISNNEDPIRIDGRCYVIPDPADELGGMQFVVETPTEEVYYDKSMIYHADHQRKTVRIGDPVSEKITQIIVRNRSIKSLALLSNELIKGEFQDFEKSPLPPLDTTLSDDVPNNQYIITFRLPNNPEGRQTNISKQIYIDKATLLPKMIVEQKRVYGMKMSQAMTIRNLKTSVDSKVFSKRKNTPPKDYAVQYFSR